MAMIPAQGQCSARTAYEQAGDGSAVVLIHGLGLSRQMWQWQAPVLSEHFRVVRYDLIGHGESDKPPGPYAMADFVAQLLELVDSVRLDDFALVGFSLGGLITQAFTLAHPDRVRAVGILHSAYDRSRRTSALLPRSMADFTSFSDPKTIVLLSGKKTPTNLGPLPPGPGMR